MIGRWSPQARIAFLAVYTVVAAILSVGTMFVLWQGLVGGTAPATVVAVRSQTSYTVSFVTAEGVRCEISRKWNPTSTPVAVGDVFDVYYSHNGSCSAIRRASDSGWWAPYSVAPMMMIGGLIAWLVLRRRGSR